MKIGELVFKAYAAKKPVTLSPTGKFLTADEVLSQPSLGLGSLHTLGLENQLKLALERYALEPDFKLGVFGIGVLTKDEVIEHLKKQTNFGQVALQAEVEYCNQLMASLTAASLPVWPEIPTPVLPEKPEWKKVKRCYWLKLPTRCLFCENTTDGVTTPFANYRIAKVHPVFQRRGFTVVVLKGVDDVRSNFTPHAKNGLTVYMGGVGHGNYSLYTGHAGNRILEVGHYDPAEVKDKGLHFLSCETAGQLGPDTIGQGAKSYAGYTENFILQWDDGSTPAVDEFTLFARADSTYDLMMANGATAQQAYNSTVQAFNAAISQVPNTVAATYLTYDRDHLKLMGTATSTIQSYRYVKICFPLVAIERQNALAAAGELTD